LIKAIWFRNNDLNGGIGLPIAGPKLFGLNLEVGLGKDTARRVRTALSRRARHLPRRREVAHGLFGSAMLAVRANERSAAAAGISVVRVKLIGKPGVHRGIGGCSYKQTNVSFNPSNVAGLEYLPHRILAGITSVSGF
jgi:sulfate-transporting ATPase